jgi:hypothetical protein
VKNSYPGGRSARTLLAAALQLNGRSCRPLSFAAKSRRRRILNSAIGIFLPFEQPVTFILSQR